MFDLEVTVKENKKISDDLWVLSYECPRVAQSILPGQFLQFQVRESTDPFLRRPFSVYKIKGDTIEILYEIVGAGTKIISQMKKGDRFRSLGPLGTSFTPVNNKKVLLVGGGVGAAPLVFMSQKYDYVQMLLGFRNRAAVLPVSEAERDGSKWIYSTNDGTVGKKGYITELMKEIIESEGSAKDYFIYSCGPKPMLHEVVRIAQEMGVAGEVSLDERMGCGIGSCLGCVALTQNGYVASCKYGPIFKIEDLVLEGLKD